MVRVINQIDYVTINKRFRNYIQQGKCYHGAVLGSNLVPSVTTLRLKLI